MTSPLINPVFNALSSVDAHFNQGNDSIKFFDNEVSPFAGFDEANKNGFEELHELLPPGRKILYANPNKITIPKGWTLSAEVAGLQFILDKYIPQEKSTAALMPLGVEDIDAMIELTALTRPGPFDKRTIEFGNYFGVFEKEKLVAMTGQRLHIPGFSEISAVCTHPDFLGRGYAATLLQHQINLILKDGQTPFLHVRADNERAINLYERVGFKVSRPMNFYFLKKS